MNNNIGESIAKNTTVMVAAQMVTWVAGFVLLLFLPRYLGSEDYGRLFLAMSFAMILSVIIDFGGNYLIPKEVSKSRDKTPLLLISFVGVRTIIWFICMVGLLLFCYLAGYSNTMVLLIMIMGISKFFEGASKVIRSCFQGYELMVYPSLGIVSEQIFVATLAVAALLLGAGPIEIAAVMAAGALLKLIISIKFIPLLVDKLPAFHLNVSYKLLKGSVPYFMWSVFAVIYYRIDAVMLSTMTTESVVGWYGGAYRLFDIVMFLPAILTTVVFPIFSKLWEEQGRGFSNTFQQSLKFILIAGIPMCIMYFSFSENLVSLFYGLDEYSPSVLILQIFSLGILLVYIDFILGSVILASDKQVKWAFVGFAAVILNIGLNYLMIPIFEAEFGNGGVGAAVTTLLTEIFIMVSAVILLWDKFFKDFNYMMPLKCLNCGIIMTGIIWGGGYLDVHWLLQAIAGFTIYALIVSIQVISPTELHFLKKVYTRKKMKSFMSLTNQK
ncbi:MAG: flippase [Balneolales bacterium]